MCNCSTESIDRLLWPLLPDLGCIKEPNVCNCFSVLFFFFTTVSHMIHRLYFTKQPMDTLLESSTWGPARDRNFHLSSLECPSACRKIRSTISVSACWHGGTCREACRIPAALTKEAGDRALGGFRGVSVCNRRMKKVVVQLWIHEFKLILNSRNRHTHL